MALAAPAHEEPGPMYGTRAAADTYHSLRGNAAWGVATDAAKDAALVRATESLDGMYQYRWPGTPTGGASQVDAWPRTGAADYWGNALPSDTVPLKVESAAYELALRELQTPGSTAPDVILAQQKVLTEVKGIKWTPLGKGGADDAVPVVHVVENLLSTILLRFDYYPAHLVV